MCFLLKLLFVFLWPTPNDNVSLATSVRTLGRIPAAVFLRRRAAPFNSDCGFGLLLVLRLPRVPPHVATATVVFMPLVAGLLLALPLPSIASAAGPPCCCVVWRPRRSVLAGTTAVAVAVPTWLLRPSVPAATAVVAAPRLLLVIAMHAALQRLWGPTADVVREGTDWEVAAFVAIALVFPERCCQTFFAHLEALPIVIGLKELRLLRRLQRSSNTSPRLAALWQEFIYAHPRASVLFDQVEAALLDCTRDCGCLSVLNTRAVIVMEITVALLQTVNAWRVDEEDRTIIRHRTPLKISTGTTQPCRCSLRDCGVVARPQTEPC